MTADVDRLINQATLAELVALLAGSDFWHTVPIERLGIPRMRVSDGPVGCRGTRFDGEASINVPCSTALAATWDTALVEQIGHLLGMESRAKGVSVLLAPTVNLHRTPIGGRNFECMSEDPYLTARVAVAYVRGVQSEGVACCIKHFVGNDTEFERITIDSQIDERTLRELYLVPFEAAVREAGVWAVMSAYNRINGTFACDTPLLADVLRGEWGFDGLVMSDWFGLSSTNEAITAGLDLEMPGPTLRRGQALIDAVERGDVPAEHIHESARRVLRLMQRTGALDVGEPGPETTRTDPADIALARRAGADGMVLLRNSPRGAASGASPVLPLDASGLRRVAVIGPNAAVGQVMGGGSAHVTPTAVSHPLDALRTRLGESGVVVVGAPGCCIFRRVPEMDVRLCDEVLIDYFVDPLDLDRPDATPDRTTATSTTRLIWNTDPLLRGVGLEPFSARLHTTLTPDVTGTWRIGVESIPPVRILVDGAVVLDNTAIPPGGSFFGIGKAEQVAEVDLVAGRPISFVAEMRSDRAGGAHSMPALAIGMVAPLLGDPLGDAVELAAGADLSIVVVGTNDDWESEGWDRSTLSLPGEQDELIRRVAAASPATVVVINAGSPIAMPWLDQVDAVLVAWFPGQEMGNALVDVLTGAVEPAGRLPVTFPNALADTPAFEHHPGRNGVAQYREGRLIGDRWYSTVGRPVLFPFGFGLGYGAARIESAAATPQAVQAVLVNDGDRDAVEVVQVYAHRPDPTGDQPDQWLVGFAKTAVPAGQRAEVTVHLDPNAYRTWDRQAHAWTTPSGQVELRVGRSAADIDHRLTVTVP